MREESLNKIKIIITALLCAAVISIGVLAVSANAGNDTSQNNDGPDNENLPFFHFDKGDKDFDRR